MPAGVQIPPPPNFINRIIAISTKSSPLKIFTGCDGAQRAAGPTVIIDVCRAFTTACVLFGNGLKTLYVVARVEDSFRLRKEFFPEAILVGEVDGIKVDGFDLGNSPHLANAHRFDGKTAILRTSSGTVGLDLAHKAGADPILAAGFVNSRATAAYLTAQARGGSLIAMGWKGEKPSIEDDQCAEYIQALYEERDGDRAAILKRLAGHPDLARFQAPEEIEFLSQDLDICFDFDRYDFALKAEIMERSPSGILLPFPLMSLVPIKL